jgi:hypothetical protein
MLKDADGGAYCTLLCTVDSQCPSQARCNRLTQAAVGVCMYPLAFSDWVRQGNTKRLSYGLPQRADKKVPQGIVQKAVMAVQNLKSKYGIQDGDADVVTVKEFLTGLSGGVLPAPVAPQNSVAAAMAMAAPAWATGAVLPPATPGGPWGGVVATVPPLPPAAPAPNQGGGVLNAYRHDLMYHTDRLREGIPGLEREVTDAVYEVEHITDKHSSSDLLRHIMEISLVYLLIGVVYKHQALGATGVDMIPHIGFWMEYPKLVMDGFEHSKVVLGGYVGMDLSSSSSGFGGLSGGMGGSGGFEPLGRERDTFAQFEPSKGPL